MTSSFTQKLETGTARPSFAIITPAKNEDAFIERALKSVIAQTSQPSRWVIVDDGSRDNTAAIVEEYCRKYSFIRLIRLPDRGRREFASKAQAFNVGLQALDGCGYSFIGNLDADISLPPDYYETVLEAFDRDPQLGIAGGKVYTMQDDTLVSMDSTMDSVGGAIQLFRRRCLDEIGSYRALPYGGIDAAAEITARAKGWNVRKIARDVYEHRRTGSAQKSVFMSRFREGIKFHSLGYSSLFFFCRCLFRAGERPMFFGSVLAFLGFAYARVRRVPVCIEEGAVSYLRKEQTEKLKSYLSRPHFPCANAKASPSSR